MDHQQGSHMITLRTPLIPGLMASLLFSLGAHAQTPASDIEQQIRKDTAAIESQLIEWRRDIHQHPEHRPGKRGHVRHHSYL